MAKGSVRKKGKKWYGRFYIEDESGRKVQKEFAGTESKAETEADRKSTRLNSSHRSQSRMPSSA